MPNTTLDQLRNAYSSQVMSQCGDFVKIRRSECKRLGWWVVRDKETFRSKCHRKIKPRGKAYGKILAIEHDAFIGRVVNSVMSEEYQKIVMDVSKTLYTSLKGKNGNS